MAYTRELLDRLQDALIVWEKYAAAAEEITAQADAGRALQELERDDDRLREALLAAPTPDYTAWHPEAYRRWYRKTAADALSTEKVA